MTKFFSIFIPTLRCLSIFIPYFLCADVSHAYTYIESRPEAIENLKLLNPGSILNYRFDNSSIRRMKVIKYQFIPGTNNVEVEIEPADNVILLDFSDDDTWKEAPYQQDTSPEKSLPPSSKGEFEIGVGTAIISGVQTALILSSGFNQQIDQAYSKIDELQRQMGEDFAKIERAHLSLNSAITKVLMLNPSGPLLNTPVDMQSTEALSGKIRKAYKTEFDIFNETSNLRWRSDNPNFIQRANNIVQKLRSHEPAEAIEKSFFQISREALDLADQDSFLGDQSTANDLLDVAETAADVLVGLDPFTGTARSLYESIVGKNLITGNPLTSAERALATLGIVSGGLLSKSGRGLRLIEKLTEKIAPHLGKTFSMTKAFFKATGNGLEIIGDIKPLRKINIRHSKIDPKWGLTQTHLRKHFFGNGKHSLKTIDPGGTADKWMQEIMDLTQRPITQTTENGALEIIGKFPKADGNEAYYLGLRLHDRLDGTFDLITVLNDQKKFLRE